VSFFISVVILNLRQNKVKLVSSPEFYGDSLFYLQPKSGGRVSMEYPQVILFGSIYGEWRERHIIPVLDEVGVTYYNPISPTGKWYTDLGNREAEMMEHGETIVMHFTRDLPSFAGLAETGWGALSAVQRKQNFILSIPKEDYHHKMPWWAQYVPPVKNMGKTIEEYTNRSRFLVDAHAHRLTSGNAQLIVVNDIKAVAAALRKLYSNGKG
jgi:hypothetical protein